MKYLLFTDLESFVYEGKPFKPTGIVSRIINERETNLGIDLLVTFFHPFKGEFVDAWRTYSAIKVFEVDKEEWEMIFKKYRHI